MGLLHPVPFGGEWPQTDQFEGHNTSYVLKWAVWTQIKTLGKGEEADSCVLLLETAWEFEDILLKNLSLKCQEEERTEKQLEKQ